MDNYNEVVLTVEKFGENIWKYLSILIKILLKANYECEVQEEEEGIIVIRYNYNRNLGFGNATLAWITPEVREFFKSLNSVESNDTIDDAE